MSALLSMIEFVENDGFPNDYVYMHFFRDTTFDSDFLKEKYPNNMKIYRSADSGTQKIYQDLQDILNSDPNAYIKIYVEDMRCSYYYQFGYNVGLQSNRFDVLLATDGSITYEVWEDIKGDFQKSKTDMESNLASAKNGDYVIDHRLVSGKDQNDLFSLSQFENCKLWVNIKSAITSDDEKTKEEINNMHIEQKLPTEMIHELSTEKQDIFHKMVKIDVEEFREKYFTGDKPPLFIIGTSGYGHFTSVNQYIVNLEEVYDRYHEKYQIIYKPHPRYPPKDDEKLNEFFNEYNIKVIEDSLPFEVIMASFDNCVMGGFDSTIYLSAEPEQVLFFFASGPEELNTITASAGEIAGIVIGVVAFVAIVVGLIIFFIIRKKKNQNADAEVQDP